MFIYPWGDMHSLNLGWFLLQFKDWVEKIQEYLDNGGGTSENLANVIAPVFNAANSYSSGDYVLYNNELYKANQAVNPGMWDPEKWDHVLIVDEMGSGGAGVDNVARLMIAGQYSPLFGYQKYAICRYNDKLWMANTDLPSGGEAWNAAHWDEITVGAGLTGLRRSVETLSEDIVALNGAINVINGEIADLDNTIAQTATDWLNQNITQETGYVIDKSLSVEDAAADALYTGGKIYNKNFKNLYDPTITSIKISGITATKNLDGSITFSGQNTSATAQAIALQSIDSGIQLYANHIYIFASNNNANIDAGLNNTLHIDLRKVANTVLVYERGCNFGTVYIPTEDTIVGVFVRVPGNQDFSTNVTMYPTIYDITTMKSFNTEHLTVLNYNIGNFSNGNSAEASGTDAMRDDIITLFGKIKADLMCFSEWDNYFNYANSTLASTVFKKLCNYCNSEIFPRTTTPQSTYIGQMIYSIFPCFSYFYNTYTSDNTRCYTINVFVWNNKVVYVFNTHLGLTHADRVQQITQLLTYISTNNIKTFIICGDMNYGVGEPDADFLNTVADEIALFENANAKSAQNSIWGLSSNYYRIPTAPKETRPVKPNDDIIVSSDIEFEFVNSIDSPALSDHYPIYATLKML